MNTKMWIVALGMCTVSVGCQNSNTSSEGLVENTSSTLSCVPGAQKLSTEEGLEIVGGGTIQAGQVARYKLNQAMGCDSSEAVVWKVDPTDQEEVVGDSLQAVYAKPGYYVVTAKIADVSSVSAENEVSRKAQAVAASSSSRVKLDAATVVVSDRVVIVAPQVVDVDQEITAQLAIPAATSVYEAIYNFGDGSPLVSSLSPVKHTYKAVGSYTLSVAIQGNNGAEGILKQTIQVLEPELPVCSFNAAITGPSEVEVRQNLKLSVHMPDCLAEQIGAIKWEMGDGVSYDGRAISHQYSKIGDFEVTAILRKASDNTVLFTLKHEVKVTDGDGGSTGNLTCAYQNQTRESIGSDYKEKSSCGLDGSKENTYRDTVREQCQSVAGQLVWSELSRSKDLVSEGSCQGQSCAIVGGKLVDGASQVFYSSSNPVGSCAEVSQTRLCTNGVLSGSSSHTQVQCSNGCVGFGAHGTIKNDVVTGEVSVPKVCKFGETGILDIFNQTSTQKCVDGQVVNSNIQQGTLKTAGICPTYELSASDAFTTCSADCGGSQTRIFNCVDAAGKVVDGARCEGLVAPVQSRLCDANPAAVKREEVAVKTEEANSSQTCPANQIGVVVTTREVTTRETYACVDHKVQLADTQVTAGAWVSQSYCRDYVAHRCNHDSLSNSQAEGRYQWMKKCENSFPVIKEFLANFDKVQVGNSKNNGRTLGGGVQKQSLYPTFMDRGTSPEVSWKAPTVASAACEMPATAYVAAVCVSSCATPEQLILAQEVGAGKMKYVSFVEALNSKYGFVASLQSAQSMGSKAVQKTKVDQWVTELIDSEHEMLVFKMKSGREIKVTTNHPLVDGSGYMRVSKEFKAGDNLVQLGGALDQIVSITPVKHQGKVYNVFVQSADVHSNILVLNGYLNGSAFFQNDGAVQMNKSLFRKALTRGAF